MIDILHIFPRRAYLDDWQHRLLLGRGIKVQHKQPVFIIGDEATLYAAVIGSERDLDAWRGRRFDMIDIHEWCEVDRQLIAAYLLK